MEKQHHSCLVMSIHVTIWFTSPKGLELFSRAGLDLLHLTAAPWPYIVGGGCWDDGSGWPAVLDVTQQKTVHALLLSCMRNMPNCRGEKQRQKPMLPTTRSSSQASHVPESGARASLVSTKMLLFQNDFVLLVNKLPVKYIIVPGLKLNNPVTELLLFAGQRAARGLAFKAPHCPL